MAELVFTCMLHLLVVDVTRLEFVLCTCISIAGQCVHFL